MGHTTRIFVWPPNGLPTCWASSSFYQDSYERSTKAGEITKNHSWESSESRFHSTAIRIIESSNRSIHPFNTIPVYFWFLPQISITDLKESVLISSFSSPSLVSKSQIVDYIGGSCIQIYGIISTAECMKLTNIECRTLISIAPLTSVDDQSSS